MILDDLEAVIAERKKTLQPGSYVASLVSGGKNLMLKKIAEETAEVIIASKAEGSERTISELADLWFHCMVLMAEERISYQDVFRELERRHNLKKEAQHG
ncbi:MAG: hypothetical protein OHK006_14530 [Thermodesulfovibrionales bacterium]